MAFILSMLSSEQYSWGSDPILAPAPPTRKESVTDTYFQTTVRDDYRWLEQINDPKVKEWAAARTKKSYAAALYRRLATHRGKKRALVAVANAMLQVVWQLLTHRKAYRDLGGNYFDRLNQQRLTRSLVRRLEKLGHTVILNSVA